MSRGRSALQLSGVFGVLKPAGVTSAQVVEFVKETINSFSGQPRRNQFEDDYNHEMMMMNQKGLDHDVDVDDFNQRLRAKSQRNSVGHGGTLDPGTTGVLVIGINQGTKQLKLLLSGDKYYETTGVFGARTETEDAEGKVVETKPFNHIRRESLETILKERFTGDILQAPPMYSAKRVGGKKLYELARAGQVIERKPELKTIYSIECTRFESPEFDLKVRVGKGTYIRTVVNDIGLALDTVAHMKKLARIEHGPFHLHDCVPLAGLTPEIVQRALERGEGVMAAFRNKLRLKELMERLEMEERTKRMSTLGEESSSPTPPNPATTDSSSPSADPTSSIPSSSSSSSTPSSSTSSS